jgi:hypothetical protein
VDGSRFDALARVLSTPGSRRRVLTHVAALPVLGGLAGILSGEDATGKNRRKRRKRRLRRKHEKHEKRRKRKKKCKARPIATVCAGKCGPVKNNCKKTVDCGSCDCQPTCEVCFTCQGEPNTPGRCVADSRQVGDPCGGDGKTCQPDGACTCIPDPPAVVCGDQTCGTAIDNCGQEIACTGCTGCCGGDVCHVEDSAACGSNGGACTNCLTSDSLCQDGTCQSCDVPCASGDAAVCGTALQAKLDAGGPDTVRVCPGLYQGTFSISRGVTVIGAGQGADEASDTILDGDNTGPVMTIAGSEIVTLETLRLRNGSAGLGGGGIRHTGAMLRPRDSTLANNAATGGSGGGIYVHGGSTLEAGRCTIRKNQVHDINDGGGVVVYGSAILTDCLVEENSANNYGGGMYVMIGGLATLAGRTIIRDNTSGDAGGIHVRARSTLDVGADCLITDNNPGGIVADGGANITLADGALVCGNDGYQCSGVSDPDACLEVCPA